jgi:hypothetical protein
MCMQILTDKAAQSGQRLNWQDSIVDLLKLLGMDSSLMPARSSRVCPTTAETPRQRDHERLAHQAGHEPARRQRRQGGPRSDALKRAAPAVRCAMDSGVDNRGDREMLAVADRRWKRGDGAMPALDDAETRDVSRRQATRPLS